MKATQCHHYFLFTTGMSHLLLTRTSFYKKGCEESMGHGCGQTLLWTIMQCFAEAAFLRHCPIKF